MILKESYFTKEGIDSEAGLIQKQVTGLVPSKKGWDPVLSRSALLVTDMQNYFLDPGSHAFVPSARAILSKIQLLLTFFRERKRPVIFTRHVNTIADAASMAEWWSDLIDPVSPASRIIEGLNREHDTVIAKTQYNAFYQTPLDRILKEKEIKYLVVSGVMTNLCCETSLREAFVRGYLPIMPVDATATYTRDLHTASFTSLAFGFSPVMTTTEVINRMMQ